MSALTARLDTLHQRWRAFSPLYWPGHRLRLEVESADQQASGQVHITLAPAAPDLVFAWIEQQRLAGQPPRAARLRSGDGGVAAELDF